MVDRNSLRLSATLLFVGFVIFGVLNLQFFHPGSPIPTDQAQFAAYALSSSWTAVHLGQFVGSAGLTAGLLVLFFALNVWQSPACWLGFFAAISAAVAVALAAVVYAVDGVALKQAVDAWASAPAAEKTTSFANAEAIRWLETGARSYQEFMSGFASVLFGLVIVWTARVPRPIGYLMGLSGLAFIVLGWLAGTQGLTNSTRSLIFDINGLPSAAWTIWLLIVAWRMKESVEASSRLGHPPTVSSPSTR
jgi:hypothetical protein